MDRIIQFSYFPDQDLRRRTQEILLAEGISAEMLVLGMISKSDLKGAGVSQEAAESIFSTVEHLQRILKPLNIHTNDTYLYQEVKNFELSELSEVEFSVRAKNDAHVQLILSSGKIFEIVIGGWNNSMSALRTEQQGASIAEHRGSVLSMDEHRHFVLSWRDPGVLRLHRRTEDGELHLILYSLPQRDFRCR